MTSKNDDIMEPLSLVWLRRDLRLHDHAAFYEALSSYGKIQPVFVFDRAILQAFANPQDKRLSFLALTLCQLHRQLKAMGGGLICVLGDAQDAIPALAEHLSAKSIICEEDYEPQTRARDDRVKATLANLCALKSVVDHVIVPPYAVLKGDGSPYKVFTPYSNAWRASLNANSFAEKKVELQGRLADYNAITAKLTSDHSAYQRLDLDAGPMSVLAQIGYQLVDVGEWRVDDVNERLEHFILYHLSDYKEQRDILDNQGTSKLSPYLRFGLVSVRHCARLAAQHPSRGSDCWINELIWREFYAMILYHFPHVVEDEFQEKYRHNLAWQYDEGVLERFTQGQTGFPVVDAAMRQLLQTGWMHNRARMIVASFMTKDLHLDWRLGEAHFGQYLMDYDLASNNGGWQWAASTGTDAQPYFRVFNPVLQSQRFDPDGSYIRRWVPQLRDVDTKLIHAPHASGDLFGVGDYPMPIVNHAAAKEIAIAMFKRNDAF